MTLTLLHLIIVPFYLFMSRIGTTFLQGAGTPNNEYVSWRYGVGHAYFEGLLIC